MVGNYDLAGVAFLADFAAQVEVGIPLVATGEAISRKATLHGIDAFNLGYCLTTH